MLQWQVGHECGVDVGRHHHDGRAGAVAGHLPFWRHGALLLLEAHGCSVRIQIFCSQWMDNVLGWRRLVLAVAFEV